MGCAGGGTGHGAKCKPATWPWTWGGVVTVLVPLCTLGLVLLGYGYTLAVQSVFGMDAGLVAHSLPEYLQLSTNVVVQLLSGVTDAAQQRQIYVRAYKDLLPFLVIAGAVWVLYFLIWLPRAWWAQKLSAVSGLATLKADADGQREPNLVRTMLLGALRLWSRLFAWLWQKLAAAPRALWWAGASLALVVGWPLVALALAIVAIVFIGYFLFGLLPFVGWMVGQSTLKQWVVEPAECVEVRSRDQRLVDQLPLQKNARVAAGAVCVCLQEKDGKEIARGRLVVSTSEAVILFDPLTGRVERIPVGDLTIRAVESLDRQAGSVEVVSKP